MNKISHLVKVNKLNIENQHCVIINPAQKYLKRVKNFLLSIINNGFK